MVRTLFVRELAAQRPDALWEMLAAAGRSRPLVEDAVQHPAFVRLEVDRAACADVLERLDDPSGACHRPNVVEQEVTRLPGDYDRPTRHRDRDAVEPLGHTVECTT